MKHRLFGIGALACALCLMAAVLSGCGQVGSYEPEELTPTVSTPAIGQSGTLRVGVDAAGGAPFVLASSGEMTGLDVDMAAALASQLGLKLELVDVGSDGAAAIENGTVDVVMGLSASERDESLWVSDPYVPTGVVLFASSDGQTTVPARDSSPKIAAQTSSTSAWAVENAYGDKAVEDASDLMSAFSSLETGSATYVASDAVIGTYAALRQNVDVTPIALFGAAGGYCLGVAADNSDLQEAVSGALQAISGNGVSDAVCEKWLGTSLDLSSLQVIEVSTSNAQAAGSGTSQGGSGSESASASTAGANAVVPGE